MDTPPPPQDMLMASAPLSVAQITPSYPPVNAPVEQLPILTGIILMLYPIDATPWLLFVSAPTIPET